MFQSPENISRQNERTSRGVGYAITVRDKALFADCEDAAALPEVALPSVLEEDGELDRLDVVSPEDEDRGVVAVKVERGGTEVERVPTVMVATEVLLSSEVLDAVGMGMLDVAAAKGDEKSPDI